jgi:cytochrome c peroxidase
MHPHRPWQSLGSMIAVSAALLSIPACKREPNTSVAPVPQPPASAAEPASAEPNTAIFAALPETMASDVNSLTEEKIALGRTLYYDPILSKNHDISCNSCHDLAHYGVDGKALSNGHRGQTGDRNSPTVYNSALQLAQFWDGRAESVEEQAKGPMLNPKEMAHISAERVVETLKTVPGYVEAFASAFPGEADPLTFDNAAKAIGAFERKLVTPARWDRYLAGDKTALTAEEKRGLEVFTATGCSACHAGALVGGAMYQKLGVIKPWPNQQDKGRAQVTKQASHDMMFRASALRNVAMTGPYFHDGSVQTLEQAVQMMAAYQLGRELSSADTAAIVAWLKTLTGTIPEAYIAKPKLPERGPTTPKADAS